MAGKRTDIGLSVRRIGTGGAEEAAQRRIEVERPILARNQELAAVNRARFEAAGITALNIVSSPGSGKTELLARSLAHLGHRSAVIVGDLETDNDAARLHASGIESVQITTGGVCHLEADMVAKAAAQLELDELDLLVIENVGNLVCPAAFDLGEHLRVVLLSVTEGEDKPLKYPKIFKNADVVVVTKIDIAEAVGFDRETALANIRAVSPTATVFELSAKSGVGVPEFSDWLATRVAERRAPTVPAPSNELLGGAHERPVREGG